MIKEFLDYQRNRKGLSENTLKAYEKDLQAFVNYARTKGLRWSTLKKKDIDAYLTELNDQGKTAATINRHLSSVRNLLSWAHHEGILDNNAAQYCEQKKNAQKLPEQAPTEELEKYLQEEPKTERAEIVHALISILKDTGIRIQEAADLKLEDFDPTEKTITIHGKGNKERIVYYKAETLTHLVRIASRYGKKLFPKVDQRTLRLWMIEELKPRGIRTHPHALRHSYATTLLNNGADIKTVSFLLGHSSVKTTERYATISNTTAKRQYLQAMI